MITIREIIQSDNEALAKIIRSSLLEFTDNLQGTVYYDPTTDDLFHLFQKNKSVYYVAEENGVILGGGGLYPGEGMGDHTIELVKMYLSKEARGKKLGYKLLHKSIVKAKEMGFSHVYIETLPELKPAIKLYEQYGFKFINHPIGNTGHGGCELWMILDI